MITSIKQAKARLALYGCTLTARDGEFKVRLKGSPAGSGYFTTDLNDAVESGATMAKREEMRRQGPKAALTATVNRCIAEGSPVVTEQRESLPDGMVRIMRAKVAELKQDGTVAMGADNFFSLLCRDISRLPAAPRGTNAAWLARNVFNIVSKTPEFAAFIYHN